jgi:hypothetical protein
MHERMQIGISNFGFQLSVDRTKKIPPTQLFKQSVKFDTKVFFKCLEDAGIKDVRYPLPIYYYLLTTANHSHVIGVVRRIWL